MVFGGGGFGGLLCWLTADLVCYVYNLVLLIGFEFRLCILYSSYLGIQMHHKSES